MTTQNVDTAILPLTRKVTRKVTRKPLKKISCSRGQVVRKAYSYTRKDGTRVKVPATCIVEKGRPGPSRGGAPKKRVVKISHPGSLKKYGYSLSKTSSERDESLRKILKAYGYSETIKKLNAIALLFRNTEPGYTRKIKRDMSYVRKLEGRI